MAKLKIVRQDGSELIGEITPAVEYQFELHHKRGFHRAFNADEATQTMVYWLAWEITRRAGEAPKPFGEAFVESLRSVEVLDSDPLA